MPKNEFKRQMYSNTTEIGKMKLQSVKESLYEATTKVIQYSIEMYAQKELHEFVRTDLIDNLDRAGRDLQNVRMDLQEGRISSIDITNGLVIINNFLRKQALKSAQDKVCIEINRYKALLQEKQDKLDVLEERKNYLSTQSGDEEAAEDEQEQPESEEEQSKSAEQDIFSFSEDENHGTPETDFDEEEDDEDENPPMNIVESFLSEISKIDDIQEILERIEAQNEEKAGIEKRINDLKDLQSGGKGILSAQEAAEKKAQDELRIRRNENQHKVLDDEYISDIGVWEPEAGPLYQWASNIVSYLKIIENRYYYYAAFDSFYADKEGKDKFYSCKVFVQRQIKELYVNQSNTTFEFAGELFDKDDEEHNFYSCIESMAKNWDSGIRYLTVVTNEDLPELNVFFKECLSGTNKYVDYYLIDRNELRDVCRKKDDGAKDFIYFRFIYHMNPNIKRIYWKNEKAYTQKRFAEQVIYKLLKAQNKWAFKGRLENPDEYSDGINLKLWSEKHLLSEVYFAAQDDTNGVKLAIDLEESINNFYNPQENTTLWYKRCIRSMLELAYYMTGEHPFSYTRTNGTTLYWKDLHQAAQYVENTKKFKSFNDLYGFIENISKSEYYKCWKKYVQRMDDEV